MCSSTSLAVMFCVTLVNIHTYTDSFLPDTLHRVPEKVSQNLQNSADSEKNLVHSVVNKLATVVYVSQCMCVIFRLNAVSTLLGET